MRKSQILTVACIATCFAGSAFAAGMSESDRVQVSTQRGQTQITLSGPDGSAAQEIFATLDKAGAAETNIVAGALLAGKLIRASVYYLNGAAYRAVLSIPPSSSYGMLPKRCAPSSACPEDMTHLDIAGDVAQELFTDLQKSGAQEFDRGDATVVQGELLSCSSVPVTGNTETSAAPRYSCSISIPAPKPLP